MDEAIDYMELTDMQDKFLDELSWWTSTNMLLLQWLLLKILNIYFLDEPLNNLDMKPFRSNYENIKKSLVDELGKTVVIVIHDINFASCYSMTLLL